MKINYINNKDEGKRIFLKKGIYLNDTIHGLISLSEYEKRIISTIGFNRLHDVYQNSTVYLTFPSNRTKRFEHSIGTMKLCSDMFFYSILNASEDVLINFYSNFETEIGSALGELKKNKDFCEQKLGGIRPNKMPEIKLNKSKHSLIPNNVPHQYQMIHLILIQAIRAAALLHDIGHPPFSHIVEFALKATYKEYKDSEDNNVKSKESVQAFLNVMSKYFADNKKLHEQMGDEISDSILREIIVPIDDDDERYQENLFEVLVMECVKRIFAEKDSFASLHRIVDSSLDGDRLDYVTRDSVNSGMNSGKIDYRRIINDMQLIEDGGAFFFCIPLKAINSVEDFIKRRFNIYKDIIYHHRVIKTDYLLEYTVRDLVKKYLMEQPKEIEYNNTSVIPFDISGLWFPLGDDTTVEKANALSQWNDSWLMTVLKQIFYTEYYRNSKIKIGTSEYILSQRLSELLRNKKCYYSLIKRGENFKTIDDEVRHVLESNTESIMRLVSRVSKLSEQVKNDMPQGGIIVDIKGTIDFVDKVLESTCKSYKGFILSYISRHYKAIGITSMEKFIRDIVQSETNAVFRNMGLHDIIVEFKNISVGLDKPIYFYDYNEKICTLNDISGISDILGLDSDYLPVFHVYILIKEGDAIITNERESLLKQIGRKIGEDMVQAMMEILNKIINEMEELVCVK